MIISKRRSRSRAAKLGLILLCGMAALIAFTRATDTRAADAPTSRPVAVSDEAFDAALAKARGQSGAELQQALATISSRFQSVDVCTSAGRNMWSIRTFNERPAQQVDAVRFTVPDGTHTHLYWAFSVGNLDSWYIVPVQGQLVGFEDFHRGLKFHLPPAINRNVILQELPMRLTPGEEYILWFKFNKPGRVLGYMSLVLLDDDVHDASVPQIQAAIGLADQGK